MARSKKLKLSDVKTPEQIRSRAYKFLIYPDDPQHRKALVNLTMMFPEELIWCEQRPPEHPEDYLYPTTKTHIHGFLYLSNPRWWSALCKEIGFVDEVNGQEVINYRWIRPLKYDDARESPEGFLPYLTHTGQLDKEQYPASDLIYSSNKMLEWYQRSCNALLEKNRRTSDCVVDCLCWIKQQKGEIDFEDFALWACMNQNYKGAASPVVREAIKVHNQNCHNQQYLQEQAQTAMCAALNDRIIDLKKQLAHSVCIDDFEEVVND